jgi:hypothetical protein
MLNRKRNCNNVVMRILKDLKADKGGLGISDQELESMDRSGESNRLSSKTHVMGGFSPRNTVFNEIVADESSPLSTQTIMGFSPRNRSPNETAEKQTAEKQMVKNL